MTAITVNGYRGVGTRGEDFNVLSASSTLVEGGDGTDHIFLDTGNDIVYGQGGREIIRGLTGNDTLYGDYSFDDTATPTPAGFTEAAASDLMPVLAMMLSLPRTVTIMSGVKMVAI